MATTFAWSASTLERHTADGIVHTVHYGISAEDGTYRAGGYGSVSLEAPADGEPVIPYADLTEDIVISWVKAALGGDEKALEIQDALQRQIDEQHAPSTASGKPW